MSSVIPYSETIDIRQLRRDSIAMLRDIKQSLDKTGIKYWLDFGSLLGAVREGRSIVWDGDYDLSTLDPHIADRDTLWQEVRDKGYEVVIQQNNVKMTRSRRRPGYYKVDLHRFRMNSKGLAEYTREHKPRLHRLIELVQPHVPVRREEEMAVAEFDAICRALLHAGTSPEELETLGDIQYVMHGSNSPREFTLKHQDFVMVRTNMDTTRTALVRVADAMARLAPLPALRMIMWCATYMTRQATGRCAVRVTLDPSFFEHLAPINFHGIMFKTPTPVEKYLVTVFGKDWTRPQPDWGLSTHPEFAQ